MSVSVILAHPDKASLNYAIAQTAIRQRKIDGHTVSFHDLYAENFGPLLLGEEIPKDAILPEVVRNHCTEIQRAEKGDRPCDIASILTPVVMTKKWPMFRMNSGLRYTAAMYSGK